MKLIHVIIASALLICTGTLVQAQSQKKEHHHVSVLSMQREVFYFKVDSEFMGATVEVTDSTGTVFFNAELHSKRNLIDFFYMEAGQYTIRFELNGVFEEYQVLLDRKEPIGERAHSNYFKLHG